MTLVESGPLHVGGRGAAAKLRLSLSDWVVQRGVLFGLVTAPLASLFLGLFRITTPRSRPAADTGIPFAAS